MDVRARTATLLSRYLLTLNLCGGGFRPRHLRRSASTFINMKVHWLRILVLVALFCIGANAQNSFNGRDFAGIKKDYNQVGIVAHVKIKSIKFAAPDVHPLYVVESEIIELFKGKVKKAQSFTFYFHAEEDYDVKQLIGNEWVVFLEGKFPIPPGGNGWYELENSKLPPSKMLSKKLKQLRKK